MTELLDGPDGGRIEILRTGSGEPVTVFAHGIAASIAQTRPFGSGVHGTRVYLHFRGHGGSTAPEPASDASSAPWTYAALAADLLTVADHTGATRALGVSMGAHSLLSLVASTPDRFERLAFVIPAALDAPSPSEHGDEMADLVERRDLEGLTRMLVAGQPAAVRDLPAVRVWARRHATEIAGTALATALREVPAQVPLPDGVDALRAVLAPSLVIAQEGDDLHPVDVAARLAGILPNATLEVLPPGAILWRDRNRLRELVSGHFNAASHGSPSTASAQ